MNWLHDEEDHAGEPVRGLPQALPEGESLLWQGRPDTLAFAVHAFHVRVVLAWFVLATLWRLANLRAEGAAPEAMLAVVISSLVSGVVALGVITLIAWLMARSTVYSVTSRRVVLRFGVAIRKYVNLPFEQIASADIRQYGAGKGDIVLSLAATGGVGYLKLWPHVRPLRFTAPQPMLRGLVRAPDVAETLARAISAHAPGRVGVRPAPDTERPAPQMGAQAPAGV